MGFNMKTLYRAVLACALYSFAVFSHAAFLPDGTYRMHDHPDSGLSNSLGPYGLRMDDLAPSGVGPVFSVEQKGAEVFLELDNTAGTATINGLLYNNQSDELWQVKQVMNGLVMGSGADGSISTDLSSASAMTLIDPLLNEYTYDPKALSSGESFLMLADGHRCGGTTTTGDPCISKIVMRSWFMPITGDGGTNDWLVQLTPVAVPAPAPLALIAISFTGLFLQRRRRCKLS